MIHLSAETIALLTSSGHTLSDLIARATLNNGMTIQGFVDEDERVQFERFPKRWKTAIIDLGLNDSGMFERCLVTPWTPHVTMDAVSTVALTISKARPLKYLMVEKQLRRSLKQVAAGKEEARHVANLKTVLMTALITRAIIGGELSDNIEQYLKPDETEDLKLTVPDYENDEMVSVAGCEFAPNAFGIATAQDGILRRGVGPYMNVAPVAPWVPIENPFHGRLRERAVHEHTDVFIDLDKGTSQIVPENTLPDEPGWDVCCKHMRDGWPYIRLNYNAGVSGANLGPVDWGGVKNVSKVDLYHGPEHPGILIIAHGEPSPEWNLAVSLAVDRIADLHPEAGQWPIELAFLEDEMLEEDSRNEELGLTGHSIADAIENLRRQGVEWMGVVPLMINNCSSHIEEIRWLMGQSVGELTATWMGALADTAFGEFGFEGFLGQKNGDLSGEFAVLDFDDKVPEMEGGLDGTVDADGNLVLEGAFSGYSDDETAYCELTLDAVSGTADGDTGNMAGSYSGSWEKKERQVGGTWEVIGEGTLSGTWSVNKNDSGKPDLSGIEVFLGSAISDHPLMREINALRTQELIVGKDPTVMGLILGVHGADLEACAEQWYEMGDRITTETIDAGMPFAAAETAFMANMGMAVSEHVGIYGSGNAALILHMVAPGSLTAAMPYVIGWPRLRPGVDYLYNQKTLLAYKNQEAFNLPDPPFSTLPGMNANELSGLILDATSDLFTDWMALHARELVSAYPVDDNWHGEKKDGMLEMTDNVYVIKTDRQRYAKIQIFTAGNGMISMAYAYQPLRNRPVF